MDGRKLSHKHRVDAVANEIFCLGFGVAPCGACFLGSWTYIKALSERNWVGGCNCYSTFVVYV